MNRKLRQFLAFALLCLLPISARAQCPRSTGTDQDKLCWSLQYILYAAQTDYREFRAPQGPSPEVSLGSIKVPCRVSAWLNNVAMYMCYAELPLADSQQWYAGTMTALKQLQYQWHFKVESPGTDHYVDGGPPDCEVPPQDGPYFGQCPLHLQEVTQLDGTSKVYLWLNSYTSAYLAFKPPSQPSKSGRQSASGPLPETFPACDDLCQGLKKVFEARSTAFRGLYAVNSRGAASNARSDDVAVKLAGSSNCAIASPSSASTPMTTASDAAGPSPTARTAPISTSALHSGSSGPQYVCYWPEDSSPAAETRFHNLSSRIQIAMPSDWSSEQGEALDPLSGAKVTYWIALDPNNNPAVRLYLSGQSVGLHISAE
jgi:hypothetical protein